MKIKEFAQFAVERDPRGLGKLQEKKAAAIVRSVLDAIAARIDETADGEVFKAPLLGSFRVSTKPAEGDKPARRRIAFRRAKVKKTGGAQGGASKGRAKRNKSDDALDGDD